MGQQPGPGGEALDRGVVGGADDGVARGCIHPVHDASPEGADVLEAGVVGHHRIARDAGRRGQSFPRASGKPLTHPRFPNSYS